ncbi:MAG TPA: DUF4097 family beta strand repeat-containing protein [Acidobacteriota bacterium]|nr:DUF4097 family beta strand repeat-containing protein [Acidobacteriota bacterium]
MTRYVLMVAILAVALTAAIPAAVVEKSFTVREDVSVKINTVAGNITVIAWDRSDEVRVKAEIVGDYVQPEFEQGEGWLRINEKHDSTVCGGHAAVHFEVYLPRAAALKGNTVSGDLSADGVTGSVKLNTVSGHAVCRCPDSYDGQLSLNSVSGELELELGRGADVRFHANTMSGDIACRLKLDQVEKHEAHISTQLRGQLGSGRGQIELNTVSGDITVR